MTFPPFYIVLSLSSGSGGKEIELIPMATVDLCIQMVDVLKHLNAVCVMTGF